MDNSFLSVVAVVCSRLMLAMISLLLQTRKARLRMSEVLSQDPAAISGRARSRAWQRGSSSLLCPAAFLSVLSCGQRPVTSPPGLMKLTGNFTSGEDSVE